MKSELYLAQTTLEVNTNEVFITDGLMKFYRTKCNIGVVSKNDYDVNGRDVLFYSFKQHPFINDLLKLVR